MNKHLWVATINSLWVFLAGEITFTCLRAKKSDWYAFILANFLNEESKALCAFFFYIMFFHSILSNKDNPPHVTVQSVDFRDCFWLTQLRFKISRKLESQKTEYVFLTLHQFEYSSYLNTCIRQTLSRISSTIDAKLRVKSY